MRFTVLPPKAGAPAGVEVAFLERNDWDDFGFHTSFELYYRDLGRAGRPDVFDRPDDRFFSLGQDDSYFAQLNALGDQVRDEVLAALNDVAVNADLFARALGETVTGKSLLRNVSRATVRNQFNRLAPGGARLSAYEFSYTYPSPHGGPRVGESAQPDLNVVPESQPPTNVHVIIGRNWVGKSRLLNRFENALIRPDSDGHGRIDFASDAGLLLTQVSEQFSNLVSVAFRAFDDFEPIRSSQDRSRGLGYTYIGAKKERRGRRRRSRWHEGP